MSKSTILSIVAVVVLLVVGFLIFKSRTATEMSLVTNFEECKNVGYPILESYPAQCKTPDGRTFVEAGESPAAENPDSSVDNSTGINLSTITNFEKCRDAGYPILESYPAQCKTPDGRTFVEVIAK